MLRALFDYYAEHPPPSLVAGATEAERVVDYLAGMTDRFAIRAFSELSRPAGVLTAWRSTRRTRSSASARPSTWSSSSARGPTCGASGSRWTGLCPFHDERTPSFSVNAEQKLYHCFGCGESGDAIRFVQETEALDFPRAVESLADRYGVELKREDEDPEAEERRRRRERLLALVERAAALLRARTCGSRRRRRRRASTSPSAGWGRRCCATSASATRPARGTA